MGTAAYEGKGFKERARVSGERLVGAASCGQQYIQALGQPTPPTHTHGFGVGGVQNNPKK